MLINQSINSCPYSSFIPETQRPEYQNITRGICHISGASDVRY